MGDSSKASVVTNAVDDTPVPVAADSVSDKKKEPPSHLCLVEKKGGKGKGKKGGEGLIVNCKEATDADKKTFNAKKTTTGGADIKTRYKKTLNKKTVEDLRKMAKGKGIKITTKKDGKSVYLKKSSIINKLCNFKHPKKTVKKTTKRK